MDLGEAVRDWHPEDVHDQEVFDPAVAAAAAGMWNADPPTGEVPPLWHWFHFLDWVAQRRIGPDGHPADGHFLPPLPDRRRMFAGGTWTRHAPLRYGEPVHRKRSLADVRAKHGRSGDLLFVTVRTELSQDGRLCHTEEQDIVYRSGPSAIDLRTTRLSTEPPPGPVALPLHTDEPLLFRMSALTANQHRIHYDRPYTVDVEHYPALVVHGPLLVLHMLEVIRRSPDTPPPNRVSFRLRSPAFVGEPLAAVSERRQDGTLALRIASAREPAHATAEVGW